MTVISYSDKEYIRLSEEYRQEIRIALRRRYDKLWQVLEKFGIPFALVLVTALISGLLVPYILRVDDDQRSLLEVKSRLITDVVSDSATAQMAVIRYQEQMCDYWDAALGVEMRKRLLRLRYEHMTAEERAAEYSSLVDDRRRENERRIQIDSEYANARTRLAVASDRLNHVVTLHYGQITPLTTYSTAMNSDFAQADDLVNIEQQEKLGTIYSKARSALASCATEIGCRSIIGTAREEIETVRMAEPKFEKWMAATQPLVVYLASHDPDMKNRVAKAAGEK